MSAAMNLAPANNDANKNDKRYEDLVVVLKKLGSDEAGAQLAKPKMALAIAMAAHEGVIGSADAKKTYNVFLDSRVKKVAASAIKPDSGVDAAFAASDERAGVKKVDGKDVNTASYDANVSKNKAIIDASVLARIPNSPINFPQTMRDAAKIRQTLADAGENVKPLFDVFVDAARAQKKKGKDANLTEAEISEVTLRPGKGETEEATPEQKLRNDLLTDWKRLKKRIADTNGNADLIEAQRLIGKVFSDLGGDVKEITQSEEDKKREELLELAKSLGLKVSKARK